MSRAGAKAGLAGMAMIITLAGCGSNLQERVASGVLIGAGAGVILTGGLAGAALGGLAGAGAGAVVNEVKKDKKRRPQGISAS